MAARGDRVWQAVLAINALALAYFVARVPAADAAALLALVVLLDVAAFVWQVAAAVGSLRQRPTLEPAAEQPGRAPDDVVEVILEW